MKSDKSSILVEASSAEWQVRLQKKLERFDCVNRLDSKYPLDERHEGIEATSLAHCFSDIAGSIEKIYTEHIPELLREETDSQKAEEILEDVLEELRHISYHLNDPYTFKGQVSNE